MDSTTSVGWVFLFGSGEMSTRKKMAIQRGLQEFVLERLFFLMYANDMGNGLVNPCFIFADDIKLLGRLS